MSRVKTVLKIYIPISEVSGTLKMAFTVNFNQVFKSSMQVQVVLNFHHFRFNHSTHSKLGNKDMYYFVSLWLYIVHWLNIYQYLKKGNCIYQ